jgi:thioredoxin 1
MASDNSVSTKTQNPIAATSNGTVGKVGGIVEVTDANFDQVVLKNGQPVMVDFWATWCGPCKALAPVVDEVAAAYSGKVVVGKMDVDQNPSTPQRYGVRGIPTLLIFRNGQVQEQIVGLASRDKIERALNKQLIVD